MRIFRHGLDKFYVCQNCLRVFEGKAFETWSGGGITIKENDNTLCLECAGRIAKVEAELMEKQGKKEIPTRKGGLRPGENS